MTRRYFAPDLPIKGGVYELSEQETQHAIKVMRIQVDDKIQLFDGQGNQAKANVIAVSRKQCVCEAAEATFVSLEPSRKLHLAIALPKPDRARELIERLTELGVTSVTPLQAERSQRPPSDSMLGKLRRGIVEACKQCGRNHLLELRETLSAEDFFTRSSQLPPARLIAHPSPDRSSARGAIASLDEFVAAVGPEGGWNDREVELARDNQFTAIDLGRRILRIETAAACIAALAATD